MPKLRSFRTHWNTFTFEHISDAKSFVSGPTQAQVRAIKVLGLSTVAGTFLKADLGFDSVQDKNHWYASFGPFRGLTKIEVEDEHDVDSYDLFSHQVFGDLAEVLRRRVPGVSVTIWDKELRPSTARDF
jgi:hypothetical protein